jgi:hypothetical protein
LESQQNQYKNQLNQIQIDHKKNLKLENKLKENQLVCQNIQMALVNIKQRNSQFEQDNQKLRLDLAIQTKFAENLQTQITLQNEKQVLANNLAKQLEENELTNEQFQIQISQLKQENLQEKLIQTKVKQERLIEQQEQLENKLSQSQANYQQIEEENNLQVQELINKEKDEKAELKAKLEEIAQLEKK